MNEKNEKKKALECFISNRQFKPRTTLNTRKEKERSGQFYLTEANEGGFIREIREIRGWKFCPRLGWRLRAQSFPPVWKIELATSKGADAPNSSRSDVRC